MSDQPEALRLAEYMDAPLNDPRDVADAAAAELRRLHAEYGALKQRLQLHDACNGVMGERGYVPECISLRAECDALRAECEGRRENERKFSLFMHAVMDERDKLRDFALPYAICPCCSQADKCVDDCTFSSDDPNAAEAMDAARAALKEVKP